MADPGQQRVYPVRMVGPVARRLASGVVSGRVAAVFRSALYIDTGPGMICVGTCEVEPGPINLITAAPAGTDWRASGLRLRQPVAISPIEVRAGSRLRFPLAGAVSWLPDPVPGPVDPAALVRGLAAFRSAFARRSMTEGIGRLMDPAYAPDEGDRECRAAKGPIAAARRCLPGAFRQAAPVRDEYPEWASRLIGLGSGLTPAGDDFLGGMMIALSTLGETGMCRSLWRSVRPLAEASTNAISVALLAAASEGLGSASVHDAISGILRGDVQAIGDAMPGLGRIGHSSGWDAMTGVVTALDCWVQSQTVGAS